MIKHQANGNYPPQKNTSGTFGDKNEMSSSLSKCEKLAKSALKSSTTKITSTTDLVKQKKRSRAAIKYAVLFVSGNEVNEGLSHSSE